LGHSLQDKVVLVTGASSGIGQTSALTFAREGAKVIVSADKNIAGGEETVKMIREAGGSAAFIKCDVSKAVEVEALVNKTVETYGRLDCAFNNAGVGGTHPSIIECTEEDYDRTMNVNLKGVWLCLKYEIIYMIKHGGGVIVNMASMGGLIGTANVSAYNASKHGVIGLTKSIAIEYARDNIRVNAVCPGLILTKPSDAFLAADPEFMANAMGKTPMGRMGTTREVAETVVWLCSDAASFITGQSIVMDGGYTVQ
jgi:NAD(P)-dependent dehydrogenase (short-subunit alcohol dehydrogenase family)